MKKHIIILTAALVIIGSIIWSGRSGDTPSEEYSTTVPVRVGYATREVFTNLLKSLGTTEALMDVEITTEKSGKITAIHFFENQAVEEGELLVELESSVERAALQEARVTLLEDHRVLQHYQQLVKRSAISQTVVEEQKARVAASEARLVAAEAALSELSIKAPFAGVLGFRLISPGTLIEPGTPITTLDAINTLKLEFTAPEFWIGKIAVGDELAAVSVAYPERIFEARVEAVGNRVDPVTRAVVLKARLENKEHLLKPGMLLEVTLQGASRETLVIDEEALLQEGKSKFVYLVVGKDKVKRQSVETGVRRRGKIEILSGLEVGDRVVREGMQKIRSGSKITILASGDA